TPMYFYLFKSTANNQWYFNIRAANHERIASSEGYHNKQDAINTINVIRRGAATAGIYDASVEKWAA
ncbi:YegP family protein, partial [Rhodanobacter spathiphylli]